MPGCERSRCMLRLGMEKTDKQYFEIPLDDELPALLRRRIAATDRAKALLPVLEHQFKDRTKWESYDSVAAALNKYGVPAARGGEWQRGQVSRLLNIGEEHSVEPQQFFRIKHVIARLESDYPDERRSDLSRMYFIGVNERFDRLKRQYDDHAITAKNIQFDLRRAVLYPTHFRE